MPIKQTTPFVLGGCLFLLALPASANASLKKYIDNCFDEIGVHVPAFNCLDGEPIVGQEQSDGSSPDREFSGPCANPEFFNNGHDCGPGRLHLLYDDGDAMITALCRKDDASVAGTDRFGDIAIIQTRRSTGATCFYQKPLSATGQDPEVPAPVDAVTGLRFLPPAAVLPVCTRCHDSANIIRTPYVTQTVYDGIGYDSATGNYFPDSAEPVGQPVLPTDFNRPGDPYWVVSYDEGYQDQAFTLDTDDNVCTSCHTIGTKLDFSSSGDISASFNSTTGILALSALSVLPIEYLQNDLNRYLALDPNVEKWWMPAGRVSTWQMEGGAAVNPWLQYGSYQSLDMCRDEFIEMNVGRNVRERINYPDHPRCRVKPRGKLVNLSAGESHVYRLNNYEIPFLVLAQDENDEPGLALYSTWGPQTEWGFYSSASLGFYFIWNEATNEFLCIDNNSKPKSCAVSELANNTYQWKIKSFNDYLTTVNGLPSGISFRIESNEFPGNFLYINPQTSRVDFGTVNLNPTEPEEIRLSQLAVWQNSLIDE